MVKKNLLLYITIRKTEILAAWSSFLMRLSVMVLTQNTLTYWYQLMSHITITKEYLVTNRDKVMWLINFYSQIEFYTISYNKGHGYKVKIIIKSIRQLRANSFHRPLLLYRVQSSFEWPILVWLCKVNKIL